MLRHVTETGSTNADLVAATDAGTALDRTALRADHQTAGRGRLDRRWDAPPGVNLLASLLFVEVPDRPSLLPRAVAIASLEAVEAVAGRRLSGRLGLKWPNDLLLDERKLSGVLAQRTAGGSVVVGIGLNVGWAPDGAASLASDLDLEVSPAVVLEHLLERLDERLTSGDVGRRYRDRLSTLGTRVQVQMPGGGSMTGIATDIDDEGRLVLDADGSDADLGTVTLDVGDIVHLRPSG